MGGCVCACEYMRVCASKFSLKQTCIASFCHRKQPKVLYCQLGKHKPTCCIVI